MNRVSKVYCTVGWIYAWHTCQERLFLSHETCARNLTTLTTAPILSKSVGQASWARSGSISRTTLKYSIFQRGCSKSSICGFLSPAPVASVLSYMADILYFIQEMGNSEFQLFAALNYFWDKWASVFFCNCMHPISLLKHCNFHPAKYICLYELHSVKYKMFFLSKKLKQWIHQHNSPFPCPKKNQ